MSHVRETIECLTKVFEDRGISILKAEYFRSSKFDKSESTYSLWNLLFELVIAVKYGNIDCYTRELLNLFKQEEKVVYTKQLMQQHGYLCREFSQLPEDMSSGSREVLLAIGWLMSTKKLVDQFIQLQTSPLDKESPQAQPVVLGDCGQGLDKLGPIERVRQLQLVNGRLKLSLKRLYSLYQEESRLQHQIHVCTQGVSTSSQTPHLSVLEVYLIRHPEQLKMCMKQLEKDNRALENLLNWKEHEHIFWKWMESVLLLKIEEMSKNEDKGKKPMIHYNIPAGLLGDLSIARRNLESSIMKCEPVVTKLEEIWESKQNLLDEDSFRQIETAVKVEIREHRLKCHRHLQDSFFQHQYTDPRLVCMKVSKQKSHSVQIPELSQVSHVGLLEPEDIQSEITSLEEQITRLQCQVQRTERYYRNQLDRLAAGIPEAICIQPASLTR